MVKVWGQNSDEKTVKQTGKNGTYYLLWCISCRLAVKQGQRPIRNVHDQPKSPCRPTVVNLICAVKFKVILQPPILDGWHQWRHTGRVFVTQEFLANFDRLPVFLFEFQPWTLTIKVFEKKKKSTRSEIMVLKCSYPSMASRSQLASVRLHLLISKLVQNCCDNSRCIAEFELAA